MSPDLRLRLHATQAQPCFPAASNALALLGGNGIFTATPTERITHYTLLRKVVCQRGNPFGNPRQQNRRYAALSGSIPPFVVSSPFHGLFSPFVKFGVSSFMGYLKGKSSLMIYEKYPELKYKYRNREFWCRGYYVDTAGKNAKKIEEYIRH